GDYSDFYAPIHHATNVGRMFRPDNPLLPNYKYVPLGYHGRASSIVVSGTPIRRPSGQTRDDANAPPVFGPTKRLDYELELGAYVGVSNPLGEPVPLARAEEHLWGVSATVALARCSGPWRAWWRTTRATAATSRRAT